MSDERIELRAIRIATASFESDGWRVEDVSRNRQHRGYDLLAKRGDEQLKIEVKGCSQAWHIPDPFVTEFDAERRLVADLLCVVYFIDERPPVLCAIPREAIPPEYVTPKHGYRISGRMKNERTLGRYVRQPK